MQRKKGTKTETRTKTLQPLSFLESTTIFDTFSNNKHPLIEYSNKNA